MSEVLGAARAAVSGIREALDAAKEVDTLAKDISALGDAELQARAQYRKKQKYITGDTTILSAVDEWRRLNEVKQLEQQLKEDVVKKHGIKAWNEILAIKERHIKERQELTDEFGRDLKKMRALKWWCFWAAAFCTYWLYMGGFI